MFEVAHNEREPLTDTALGGPVRQFQVSRRGDDLRLAGGHRDATLALTCLYAIKAVRHRRSNDKPPIGIVKKLWRETYDEHLNGHRDYRILWSFQYCLIVAMEGPGARLRGT